jgi:hypothetical protein
MLSASILLVATVSRGSEFDLANRFVAQLPSVLRQRGAQLMSTPPPIPGAAVAPPSDGLCASPTQWGGDPTGKVDSTEAVQAALAFCVNRSRHIDGMFPTTARDAGGCTVDLEGGEYLISTTLRIPAYTSNMQIARGSLVANAKSPAWLQADPQVGASGAACVTGFPMNRTGQWCQALQPGSGPTASLCREECCALPSCDVWQWCPPGAPCYSTTGNLSCWLDKKQQTPFNATTECTPASPSNPKSSGWIGESRPSSPAPPPSPWSGGRFMIAVGGDVHCNHPQGSCNEDVGFPQLFLDGSNVANGIQVNSVMGTTIGPTTYLLNFSSVGIQVLGGHEVMITETWLGETNWVRAKNASFWGASICTKNDHLFYQDRLGTKMGTARNTMCSACRISSSMSRKGSYRRRLRLIFTATTTTF